MARDMKMCTVCGRPYIPTSNNQKMCPDCREGKTDYSTAAAPGPVSSFKLNPEVVTEDDVPWEPDPVRPAELPDQLQWVEEAAAVLRKYYAGELVDKETAREEVLEEIREKLMNI